MGRVGSYRLTGTPGRAVDAANVVRRRAADTAVWCMNRADLLALCRAFGGGGAAGPGIDPVPEIMRSYRHAEISEREKNDLLGLVCDPDEEADVFAEAACVRDAYADEVLTEPD